MGCILVAKEKLDSTSSLRNGYVGSFTTLAQPCLPYQETEKKIRAVSMAETSPVLRQCQEQRTMEKKESTLISTHDTGPFVEEDSITKERCLSTSSETSGCAGAGKKGYRRFGEVNTEEKKNFTPRQWLLLVVLCLATLTSSFAICLFPPFFPKIVSKK